MRNNHFEPWHTPKPDLLIKFEQLDLLLLYLFGQLWIISTALSVYGYWVSQNIIITCWQTKDKVLIRTRFEILHTLQHITCSLTRK